jgi:chromosome segregation ATPase
LKNDFDICNKGAQELKNENNELKIENDKMSEISKGLNNSLISCRNQFESARYNDSLLSSNLSECKIKVSILESQKINLQNNINSLNQDYSQCKTNLNTYKNYYNTLTTQNTNLKNQVNSLTTQNNQCQNNYNSCKNQLSYYSKLPSEIQKLKEEKAQLTQKYNSCYAQLNQCYNDCPIIEYNGITSLMQSTIHELITYSYTHYSDFEARATYISKRMSEIYNKNQWSCIIGKTSSYWGYYVRHVNDLYYTYTYKSIIWTVFTGFYI